MPARRVLSAVDYMADTLGCKLVMLDSLMMVRGVVDDIEREREFLSILAGLAKYYKILYRVGSSYEKAATWRRKLYP